MVAPASSTMDASITSLGCSATILAFVGSVGDGGVAGGCCDGWHVVSESPTVAAKAKKPRSTPMRESPIVRLPARVEPKVETDRETRSSRNGTLAAAVPTGKEGTKMLYWAAIFFVVAIIAGVFGFAGIAASAAGVAKILFVVFLVLAGISLLLGRRVVT
jgi:uncharacterized membrane protein YtjA (UPF0391 family)